MDSIWSAEIDSILGIGRPLSDVGVRNWALSREVALIAINKLLSMRVAILGGDVYVLRDSGIENNTDGWYCSRENEESTDDFIDRSIAVAADYISRYKSGDCEVLFALVPRIAKPG